MSLFKCSRCCSSKLAEFFEVKKTTGIQYKTCNQCRSIKLNCGECDKVYGSISDRKKHIIVKHPEIKLTRCTKCNYDCPYDSDMETHMSRAHKNKNTTHECDRCNKIYATKSNLKQHTNTVHNKIKNFNCDQCDKSYKRKGGLKRHIEGFHDKIKNYECDKCNYICSDRNSLKLHIKSIHDKIKDFKCDRCTYASSSNSHLKRHIEVVHDKIKNITCDMCNYTCSNNTHIRSHKKHVHSDDKKYKCNKCEYTTKSNGNLKKHKIIHEVRTYYECNKCGDKLKNLKKHIKKCTGTSNMSQGEYKVKSYLDELRILHEREVSIRLKTKGCLRFDFKLIINDKILFIEYNGAQHYVPSRFGGIDEEQAKINLIKQQKHDKLKTDHCTENNIPLLWIKYTDYNKIDKLIFDFIINNSDWDGDKH